MRGLLQFVKQAVSKPSKAIVMPGRGLGMKSPMSHAPTRLADRSLIPGKLGEVQAKLKTASQARQATKAASALTKSARTFEDHQRAMRAHDRADRLHRAAGNRQMASLHDRAEGLHSDADLLKSTGESARREVVGAKKMAAEAEAQRKIDKKRQQGINRLLGQKPYKK